MFGDISPAAQDWLVAALDPFHDNQLRLEGLPDMVAAPSVVKMHNQSYTLTAPTSAAADWDATVAFTGCNSEIGATPALVTGAANIDNSLAYNHAGLSTGLPFGTFVVKATEAGHDYTWGAPGTVDDTHLAFGGSSVAPNGDRCRIIAVAFEITNTTAEIYKQGSLTVASLPSAVNDYGCLRFIDGNVAPELDTTSFQSWFSAKFAANRDALTGIPGSCTWAAKDGVYAIPRMITHTMPVEAPAFNKRAVVAQDSLDDTKYHMTTPTGSDAHNKPVFQGVASSGFSALQVSLSGLSHETSLVITMKTIVEYFPSFNSGLLQLTTPSPAFSPKAFELYSRVCQIAPYAVTVKQNGAGEYFRKILTIVSAVSGAAAPFLGPFSPLASGVSTVAKWGANALEQKEQKRELRDQIDKAVAKALPRPPGPPRKPLPMPPRVRRDEAGARAMPTRR